MRWRIACCASLAILSVAACAPTVTVTKLDGTFAPRPGLDEVAVYTTQVPECPYREIAIISAFENDLIAGGELDSVLAALKERARSIGADAVVGVHLVNKGGESNRGGYSGTAIRFTNDECNY